MVLGIAFASNVFYNTIKDPQWYDVQEGDATMMHIAASLPGQKILPRFFIRCEVLFVLHICTLVN